MSRNDFGEGKGAKASKKLINFDDSQTFFLSIFIAFQGLNFYINADHIPKTEK
jgi:hypothetical protein